MTIIYYITNKNDGRQYIGKHLGDIFKDDY